MAKERKTKSPPASSPDELPETRQEYIPTAQLGFLIHKTRFLDSKMSGFFPSKTHYCSTTFILYFGVAEWAPWEKQKKRKKLNTTENIAPAPGSYKLSILRVRAKLSLHSYQTQRHGGGIQSACMILFSGHLPYTKVMIYLCASLINRYQKDPLQ